MCDADADASLLHKTHLLAQTSPGPPREHGKESKLRCAYLGWGLEEASLMDLEPRRLLVKPRTPRGFEASNQRVL